MEDVIRMSSKELRRLAIINKVIDRSMTALKASEVLELSYRQTKRLVRRVRIDKERGIIHRLRGRPGNRRISASIRGKVIELYERKYWDFGPTFASEKLNEIDNINVCPETLRLWLLSESKRVWQRKRKKSRNWRPRKEYFGEMVQLDGSAHDWLEGRGPSMVLMGFIDDATGRVFCKFYDYEGTIPAMDSFKGYISQYGIPQSVYLDRHTTYKSTKKQSIEEQLRGERSMSQFERAMNDLGVLVIHAFSPQAKGRVERLFKTFQDRLIKEMRLRGIQSKESANLFLEEYLPVFNSKFSVQPVQKGNLHRQSPGDHVLSDILSIKSERRISNDGVVRYNNRHFQLDGTFRRTKTVTISERLDGTIHIANNGIEQKFREITLEVMLSKSKKKLYAVSPQPCKEYKIQANRNRHV